MLVGFAQQKNRNPSRSRTKWSLLDFIGNAKICSFMMFLCKNKENSSRDQLMVITKAPKLPLPLRLPKTETFRSEGTFISSWKVSE